LLTTFEWHDIEQFVRAWDVAFDRGQSASMAAVYTDDAMLVAGDSCVIGRRAIAQFWREACAGAQRSGVRRTVHADQYDTCGDLAYLQGTVSLRTEAGEPTVVWFVAIWKRHAEGSWRILADTSTVVAHGSCAGIGQAHDA